ncbi:hypothetical protein [Planctobacterium marinum]|uniref:Uncharacterized protein n=1 Tax=Planctobacterium marinum TaxID=1631968 RepID=A0AA48HSL5_9ALTE|nr:hypothetical protein MACH26_34830 [Planctobacterium marinum]
MSNKDFEQTLQDKIQSLPTEMQPEKDLWQGIDIALTSAEKVAAKNDNDATTGQVISLSQWFPAKPMALAASLVLVALIGWNGLQKTSSNEVSSSLVARMMEQHDEQKSVLLASMSESPELTDNWQAQLQELEQAATAIEAALENEPNNITLLKMLQQVHQQQLELIERVHAPVWQQI